MRSRWRTPQPEIDALLALEDEQLHEARLACVEDVQGIQAQLADRNRVNAAGVRIDDQEYQDWRGRTVAALQHKLSKLRIIKAELGKRGQSADKIGAAPRDLATLTAILLCDEIGLDIVELPADEVDDRVIECLRAAEMLVEAWSRNRMEGAA